MGNASKGSTGVLDRIKDDTREPPKYKVLIHNDDFTPQDFVVHLLQAVFNHDRISAFAIMLGVHRGGPGIAGVFSKEVAETKMQRARGMAESAGHPLQLSIEPEER